MTHLWVRTLLSFSYFHMGTTAFNGFYSNLANGTQQLLRGDVAGALKSMRDAPLKPVANQWQGMKIRKMFPNRIFGDLPEEALKILDQLESGGYRLDIGIGPELMKPWRRKVVDAWRGGETLKALGETPLAIMDAVSWLMMERYVPNAIATATLDKIKVGLKPIEARAAAEHRTITPAELHSVSMKANDIVRNTFGQQVYDNFHWNRMAIDAMQVFLLSAGWQLGNYRALGGGITDSARWVINLIRGKGVEFTNNIAYLVALNGGHMAMSAFREYMALGKWPSITKDFKSYVFPKNGEVDKNGNASRDRLPDYMGWEWGMTHTPGRTTANATAPWVQFAYNASVNRDNFGNQVYDREQSLVAKENALRLVKGLGKAWMPISLRNIEERYDETGSLVESTLAMFGDIPASTSINRSPAQQQLVEYQQSKPRQARNEIQQREHDIITQLSDKARKGQNIYMDVQRYRRAGLLSDKNAAMVSQFGGKPKPFPGFENLELDQQTRVWEKATEEERKQIQDRLQRKLRGESQKPGAVKPHILDRLKEAGFPVGSIQPRPPAEEFSQNHLAASAALLAYGPGPQFQQALDKQGFSTPPPQVFALTSQSKAVEARIREEKLASMPPSDRAMVSALLALRDHAGRQDDETA
jgi:hypothetical protein